VSTFPENSVAARVVKTVLFCALVYFPIFLHFDSLPIRIYDEARLAMNAYEMQKDGSLLVTHYHGKPDMWNTKPPLMIWMQAICMKLFGVSELSVRLPAVIAAFFTTLALLLLGIRFVKDYWFGLIACLVLVTAEGYINTHVARTGDFDSLLILFITAFSFAMLAYAESRKTKHLHLFFVFLGLAIFTKSVQPLMVLPGVFLYLVASRNLGCLRSKWVLIDSLIVVAVVAMYYFAREYHNPGYLQAIWDNELGGRYFEVNERHEGIFMYYYDRLKDYCFADWFWLIPCGAALGLCMRNDRLRKVTLLSVLVSVTYWLLISGAQTKLEWYSAPMYPFISILAAMPLYFAFVWLRDTPEALRHLRINVAHYVLAFMLFLGPYTRIIDKVYFPREWEWDQEFYGLSRYLRQALKSQHDVKGLGLCFDSYPGHVEWYMTLLNEKGNGVKMRNWTLLEAGEKVAASQGNVKQWIEANYEYSYVERTNDAYVYLIRGRKTPVP
jgi:4-amino-4-deoxy-L-arabinose transferase-like glycosyltransferase